MPDENHDGFITRSSVKPEPARWLVWLALAISLWLVALPSRAEGINPRLASLALQDGYLVANTRFAIQLNPHPQRRAGRRRCRWRFACSFA